MRIRAAAAGTGAAGAAWAAPPKTVPAGTMPATGVPVAVTMLSTWHPLSRLGRADASTR